MNDADFDRYRPLLRLHVRAQQIGRRYAARFDSSDLVQETLLRAARAGEQLAEMSESGLVRWLRTVLDRVVVDFVREHAADKLTPVGRRSRTIVRRWMPTSP